MSNQTTLLEYILRLVRQVERDEAALVAALDVLSQREYQNPYVFDHMQFSYDESWENATVIRMMVKEQAKGGGDVLRQL